MNEAELRARLQALEARAWWRDQAGLVADTDLPLAVIGPRADARPEDLRRLGQALASWRSDCAPARHVFGLSDLLAGCPPRTPPSYLMVPYRLDELPEAYEPVALVFVAAGTDLDATGQDLMTRLKDFAPILAWCTGPEAYSYYQR